MTLLRRSSYCKDCKLIWQKDVELTEHCTFCGYCVEGLDHHCPWSSKCIGDGNMNCFKAFLGSTVATLVYVVVAMMFVFGASEPLNPRTHHST